MNSYFRYQLETRRLTGHRQQKFTFRYVADDVGKCDHQHSCGYHYKPSEYYHDNQWAREPSARTEFHFTPPPLPPFRPLPMEYVLRSLSPVSTFWHWFSTDVATRLSLSPEQVGRVYDDYLIGATRKGSVIFWQIDHKRQVHGGHIMQYGPDGHRNGFQGWTHIPLIQQGRLPLDWQLCQCLFGQHLLSRRPKAHVCIVESEKTALIMAAHQPEYLWLATCGSGGLNAAKLECLRDRRFTLFPDSGCFKKWQAVMNKTEGLSFTIADQLEKYPANTDLADLLLQPP